MRRYSNESIGSYGQFYGEEPHEKSGDASTWYRRSANMVCAYSTGRAGSVLTRDDNPDEYFLWNFFVPVTVTVDGETVPVAAGSLVIVPPGESRIEFQEDGSVWRGFTSNSADLLERAANREEYTEHPDGIAPLEAWPMPPDGYRLRVYDLTGCAPAGKPRCFRHRTGMTNFSWPVPTQPRSVTALSPHSHDDFEQFSLIYAGTMVHHMRRAWSRNMNEWLPDEHVVLSSPAVAISKPPDIHTTQAVTTGGPVGLIDFFAPPRWDFSNVDGMVINRDEYPMPAQAPPTYGVDRPTYEATDPRAALNRSAPGV